MSFTPLNLLLRAYCLQAQCKHSPPMATSSSSTAGRSIRRRPGGGTEGTELLNGSDTPAYLDSDQQEELINELRRDASNQAKLWKRAFGSLIAFISLLPLVLAVNKVDKDDTAPDIQELELFISLTPPFPFSSLQHWHYTSSTFSSSDVEPLSFTLLMALMSLSFLLPGYGLTLSSLFSSSSFRI